MISNRGIRFSNNSSSQIIDSLCFAITTTTFIVSFGGMLTDHYFFITITLLSMLVILLHFYRTRTTTVPSSTATHRDNYSTTLTTSKSLIHTPRNTNSPFNRRTIRKGRVCVSPKESTISKVKITKHSNIHCSNDIHQNKNFSSFHKLVQR